MVRCVRSARQGQNARMLSDEGRAYLDAILNCEAELDGWRLRVQRIERPERGSELIADIPESPDQRSVAPQDDPADWIQRAAAGQPALKSVI